MHDIQPHLSEKQRELERHPFFAQLSRGEAFHHNVAFVSNLSFWAMAFQDVLRLTAEKVEDPHLQRVARRHRAEDAGHDEWFLSDLMNLEGRLPDLRVLFGPAHRATRDATYALVSEVFRARGDVERIVLVLALEAAGHVFFEAVAGSLERTGEAAGLRYFSRPHLTVEYEHALFDESLESLLSGIELSEDGLESARALVDRVFDAFSTMFHGLADALARAEAEPRARAAVG